MFPWDNKEIGGNRIVGWGKLEVLPVTDSERVW